MIWIELKHQIHKNLKRKNIKISLAKISNYLTNCSCIDALINLGVKPWKVLRVWDILKFELLMIKKWLKNGLNFIIIYYIL
jgi:hypothetical protein